MRQFVEFRVVCSECGTPLEIEYGEINKDYVNGERTGADKLITGIKARHCPCCYDKYITPARNLAMAIQALESKK